LDADDAAVRAPDSALGLGASLAPVFGGLSGSATAVFVPETPLPPLHFVHQTIASLGGMLVLQHRADRRFVAQRHAKKGSRCDA
jgi:hypothetical protein